MGLPQCFCSMEYAAQAVAAAAIHKSPGTNTTCVSSSHCPCTTTCTTPTRASTTPSDWRLEKASRSHSTEPTAIITGEAA